jgi:hypothetical protein
MPLTSPHAHPADIVSAGPVQMQVFATCYCLLNFAVLKYDGQSIHAIPAVVTQLKISYNMYGTSVHIKISTKDSRNFIYIPKLDALSNGVGRSNILIFAGKQEYFNY